MLLGYHLVSFVSLFLLALTKFSRFLIFLYSNVWYTTVLELLLRVSDVPIDKGRKSNVHKTFRRRPGRLLDILCTFNLSPAFREKRVEGK